MEHSSPLILQHDSVCLQEVRQDIHFPGHRGKCITRKDKASGGVGIFMKSELFEGAEMINIKEGSDYIICKLSKTMTSTLSMSMLDPIIHHAQLNKTAERTSSTR